MKELDITDGLASSAWASLEKAINSQNPETVEGFISFFRGVLRDAIKFNKIKYFRQFIFFPSQIYRGIAFRHKHKSGFQGMVNEVSGELSFHLREIIEFYLGILGKSHLEGALISEFYYEAFASFNRLLYLQSRYQDWGLLAASLKRYGQLSQDVFNHNLQDEMRLRTLTEENADGANNAEITRIRTSMELSGTFDRYRRQPIAAMKYWLLHLFEYDLIETENLVGLLNLIYKIDGYDPNKEIEDILFFRTADLRSYMNWEDWDYMERPEGEVYFPPMPSNWMTSGFVIDRIRTKNVYFNTTQLDAELMANVPYFYDAVSEQLALLGKNLKKWKWILLVENQEDFSARAKKLLESIALAKRSVIGDKDRVIAAAPLDQGYIDEFRAKMGTAWQAQTRIRRVFTQFGNIQDVTGEDIKLKLVGQNILLRKAKMMFIAGEYHIPIYGMEQLGGNIGRWEDSLFLEVIEQAEHVKILGKTILETLTTCISHLQDRGTQPTMIFLEPQYLYKDDDFLNSERYSLHYDAALNPDNITFLVLGTFDGIPIFSSYSRRLKNKIVVSDFAAAFQMLHKTDDAWFDRELAVHVLPVSDAQVNEKYEKEPDKWRITDEGIELSEQDAKTLIRTSIVIDLETVADFRVLDPSKFVIGQISEPLSD